VISDIPIVTFDAAKRHLASQKVKSKMFAAIFTANMAVKSGCKTPRFLGLKKT